MSGTFRQWLKNASDSSSRGLSFLDEPSYTLKWNSTASGTGLDLSELYKNFFTNTAWQDLNLYVSSREVLGIEYRTLILNHGSGVHEVVWFDGENLGEALIRLGQALR
jgi:hypothetical protein